MRVGIIGAGRVGCSLALALSKKGMPISGIYSRSAASAESAAQMISCSRFDDPSLLIESSDTVFITVPDASVRTVAGAIVKASAPGGLAGKVFMHCSGALSSAVLGCIGDEGGFIGSLHPIQSFPDKERSWQSMYGIYFGFEGMPEAEAAAEEVVHLLDGTMLKVDEEAKSLYHAAACVLSNYLVTLSNTAAKMLECAGVGADTGIRAFAPLLRSTVDNIVRLGSVDALTGPISRGDTVTVEAHLDALARMLPAEAELYKSMGRATTLLALEKGAIEGDRVRELMRLLGGPERDCTG